MYLIAWAISKNLVKCLGVSPILYFTNFEEKNKSERLIRSESTVCRESIAASNHVLMYFRLQYLNFSSSCNFRFTVDTIRLKKTLTLTFPTTLAACFPNPRLFDIRENMKIYPLGPFVCFKLLKPNQLSLGLLLSIFKESFSDKSNNSFLSTCPVTLSI